VVEGFAGETLDIVGRIEAESQVTAADRRRLQEMLAETRDLLTDAGYPAEPVWRSLHRAIIGIDSGVWEENPAFWFDLAADLRQARETLGALSHRSARDSDFTLIG